jgi:hypothetical protein
MCLAESHSASSITPQNGHLSAPVFERAGRLDPVVLRTAARSTYDLLSLNGKCFPVHRKTGNHPSSLSISLSASTLCLNESNQSARPMVTSWFDLLKILVAETLLCFH